MKAKYVVVTAEQEVEQVRHLKHLMSAAGWEFRSRDLKATRCPFSKVRQVACLVFSRDVRGAAIGGQRACVDEVHLIVPLANFEYERSFLTLMTRRNDSSLRHCGLTENVEVNEVLEMCL